MAAVNFGKIVVAGATGVRVSVMVLETVVKTAPAETSERVSVLSATAVARGAADTSGSDDFVFVIVAMVAAVAPAPAGVSVTAPTVAADPTLIVWPETVTR